MPPRITHPSMADPQYRCCCGRRDVKQGAWLITLIEAVILGFCMIFSSYAYFGTPNNFSIFAYILYMLVAYGLALIAVLCLFVGLIKENGRYLLAYVVFMALQVIGLIVGMVFAVLFLIRAHNATTRSKLEEAEVVAEKNHVASTALTVLFIVGVVGLGIGAVVSIWQAVVITSCSKYFNALHRAAPPSPNLTTTSES